MPGPAKWDLKWRNKDTLDHTISSLNHTWLHLYHKYNKIIIFKRATAEKQINEEKQKIPEANSNVLSVRLQFCDRFSSFREARSLIFFTPASVNPPPHISRDWRFLKSVWYENT